ncbi:MAG: hypothetical protein NTY64_17685, partial [Deltaproteobacteria bacterium]|nr:hypothetical protein [Deltaproteobacteria bacterium]
IFMEAIIDGFVKNPSVPFGAGLRFTFFVAVETVSTPHLSAFARLASGAFYKAISLATFYEIIKLGCQLFSNLPKFITSLTLSD